MKKRAPAGTEARKSEVTKDTTLCPHFCSAASLKVERTPPNSTPSTTNNSKEGKALEEIERLAQLSAIKYDQEREASAKKLGVRVTVLDEAVKQQSRRSAKSAKQATAFDEGELRRTAGRIIAHTNILDLFGKDFGKVIAGEETNGKLLYLVATGRLFDNTMHAAIKGTSAGGKSEIRKRVLEFFPPESVVSFTSLSEKALIYYHGDFAHKILSMGEATATDEQNFQDYLLRELMSEGRIRYPTVQKVGGELIAGTIEKNGPVAFLVTTTKNKLHPENETRMLSLEIDDSEHQTKKVLAKVAQVEGLNRIDAQVDYKPWQDFQRWLDLGERRVVVPFAGEMVELIPPAAVRLRRDVGQVIRAVKAHALLHREQRGRDDAGQIVANIEHDYATVRELLNCILAEGSGVAVTKAIAETIDAVAEATKGVNQGEGASAQDIARILKLDKSAARRRLLAARDEGFVVNLEQRKGMPGKYRVTSQKVERANILPDAAMLLEHFRDTDPTDTPPKSVPPCHREEKAEIALGDNGGKAGGNPVDGGEEWQSVANGLATDKPQDGNGKSSPVAGWQCFSGGYDDLTIPPILRRNEPPCDRCGLPGGTELDYDGLKPRLHPHCTRPWIDAYEARRNGTGAHR
jgi:hypothetical protein